MSKNYEKVIVDELEQSPEDLQFQVCEKLMRAGIWLIRNGFGRMAILPYVAPSGCYWRCEFHPLGRPSMAFFRYSSASGANYLQDHSGPKVRRNISTKRLAEAIMASVPSDLLERCAGDVSAEIEGWLMQVERALSQRWIPAAFHNESVDYSKWDLVSLHGAHNSWMDPPPGYVVPSTEES